MTGFLRFNVSQMGNGQVYDVLESAMKPGAA
jgi:hypothetical protein